MVGSSQNLTRLEGLRRLRSGGPFDADMHLRGWLLALIVALFLLGSACENPTAPNRQPVRPVPTTHHL